MEHERIYAQKQPHGRNGPDSTGDHALHPAWLALIRYCRELNHGELERLSIQDGLPVIAEHVRQKVKFKL